MSTDCASIPSETYQLMVEQCSTGILVQREGRVVYANRAALDCLGFGETGEILDRQRSEPPGAIRISTMTDDNHVVITVSDNGCGIPPEVQPRLFEPFFTTKEVGRGTGQGLAIARAATQKHGGTIDFDSTVGLGTTFTLRLPVAFSA